MKVLEGARYITAGPPQILAHRSRLTNGLSRRVLRRIFIRPGSALKSKWRLRRGERFFKRRKTRRYEVSRRCEVITFKPQFIEPFPS